MPGPLSAQEQFQKWIYIPTCQYFRDPRALQANKKLHDTNYRLKQWNPYKMPKGADIDLFEYRNRQAELDAAMWYGAAHSDTSRTIIKIFGLLKYGGLHVYRDGYIRYRDLNIPLAVVLSHGGRIMVQIPRVENKANRDDFFNWLNQGGALTRRKGATHAVENFSEYRLTLSNGRKLYIKETGGKGAFVRAKISKGAYHYGFNISMGGFGMINPLSGNFISNDGQHGHLYVHYQRPRTNKNGALLIGCEGSAPIDQFQGEGYATDQTGHKHKFGGSGNFGVTGGLKFKYKPKVRRRYIRRWKWKKSDSPWHNAGPDMTRGGYVIVLTRNTILRIQQKFAEECVPNIVGDIPAV